MSEIKGQLLGIILVLIVFGAISVGMVSVFKSTASNVADRASEVTVAAELEAQKTETPSENNGFILSGSLLNY